MSRPSFQSHGNGYLRSWLGSYMKDTKIRSRTIRVRIQAVGIVCVLFSLVPVIPQVFFNLNFLPTFTDFIPLFMGISILVWVRFVQRKDSGVG
jgi:hypothetical protein